MKEKEEKQASDYFVEELQKKEKPSTEDYRLLGTMTINEKACKVKEKWGKFRAKFKRG